MTIGSFLFIDLPEEVMGLETQPSEEWLNKMIFLKKRDGTNELIYKTEIES